MSSHLAVRCSLKMIVSHATPDGTWSCTGWLFGQGTTHCCAVRACGAEATVHGIYGLPRPDVAATHPAEPQTTYCGFQFNLSASSLQPIRLEWLDNTGRWHEFWREPISELQPRSKKSQQPRRISTSLIPVLHAAIATGITNRPWWRAWQHTRELMTEFTGHAAPDPVHPTLLVNLDQPHGEIVSGELVPISGWIFNHCSAIRRIFAHAEPDTRIHLIFPKPRPDVGAAYSTLSVPLQCGFDGMILLPKTTPVCFYLRLYAELADGSVVLALARRFFCRPFSETPASLAPASLWLGVLGLAGIYQPTSWRDWWQLILSPQRLANPVTPPASIRIKSGPLKSLTAPIPAMIPRDSDPLISLIVPVYNTPEPYLRAMIASVQVQSYPRWEMCLADDASTQPHVRHILAEYARTDPRIRPVYRPENGHISRASNSALAHAQGKFIALLDHDDLLAPEALQRVIEVIRAQPKAQFLYTNRDKIDDQGRHFDGEERGAWNPAMAITHNYLHHLTVIRRSVVLAAGAFRPDYFGSQDLDLYLRCHELLRADEIVYVPFIAYHWRAHAGSTASRGDQKAYMFDSARRGIADALHRRGLRATPFLPNFGTIYGMNLHQLNWDPGILQGNPVSIIIAVPSAQHDFGPHSLAKLIATVPAVGTQIIIVSTRDLASARPDSGQIRPEYIIAPIGTPEAGLYNLGAAHARNPLLLLLDAETSPIQTGWLEDLVGWLSVPGVAAVGPKLIASDGLLASAGWTVHSRSHLPLPLFAGDPVDELNSPFLSHSARDVLLLDPSCVLTRTADFRELGGFEHKSFPAQHFVADYGLRLRDLGRRSVYSPQAVLETSKEILSELTPHTAEDVAFQQRYTQCQDPWISQPTTSQCLPPSRPSELQRKTWMPAATLEFTGGWLYLEQPFPGEEIHAGHQLLRGWCLPRPGQTIAELKVRIGAHTYLADLGHPRPDLTAHTGCCGDFLPAGFSLELALPCGPARLEIFVYLVGSGWQLVGIIELEILAQRAPTKPDPAVPVPVDFFADAVELLLKKSAENPTVNLAKHAALIACQTAALRTKRYAVNPFQGFIDCPHPHFVPIYGGVYLSGWLFHETIPIRRVVASYDLTGWIELPYGNESACVSSLIPEFPQAAHCAFVGFVPVPQDLPPPRTLRIWAELADGNWKLVFVLRSRTHSLGASDLRTLHGVSGWTLLRTTVTLQLAFFRWHVRSSAGIKFWTVMKEMRQRIPAPMPRPQLISAPRVSTKVPATPHLLLVTHNLNREGAPLFLYEIARFCQAHLNCNLTVVSPHEGSLRSEYEQLGAEVRIIDRAPLWSASTEAEVQRALRILEQELRVPETSLVVANTIESFWAVSAAQHAGRPSLCYIHEPGVLGFHYLRQLSSPVRRAAATALAQATCVSFPNRATQAYYQSDSPAANYCIQPGWTDCLPPEVSLSPQARARLRARWGFAPPERVVINVGTLCARKGQLVFVRAVEHLWKTQPALAARCRFLLIGANDNDYAASVAALIQRLDLPNLALIPATKQVQEYFSAADLFTLSSFEEGFSRVLLEAMGHGLPIVSTAIHGIPEITRHHREALLVPPGDAPALAAAMQLLLQDEVLAARLGRQARERLEHTYTAERVLPLHLATIRQLARDLKTSSPKIPARDLPEPIQAAV